MKEDGKLVEIDKPLPGENFADNILRFTPREVVIEPNTTQVVRIQVRKPAKFADGEYRAHLLFRAIPNPQPATGDANPPDNDNISIQLQIIYGVSIPIVVLQGHTTASIALSDITLLPRRVSLRAALSLRIHRTGNRTVYGAMRVEFLRHGARKPLAIGEVKNIAVYNPSENSHCDDTADTAEKPVVERWNHHRDVPGASGK